MLAVRPCCCCTCDASPLLLVVVGQGTKGATVAVAPCCCRCCELAAGRSVLLVAAVVAVAGEVPQVQVTAPLLLLQALRHPHRQPLLLLPLLVGVVEVAGQVGWPLARVSVLLLLLTGLARPHRPPLLRWLLLVMVNAAGMVVWPLVVVPCQLRQARLTHSHRHALLLLLLPVVVVAAGEGEAPQGMVDAWNHPYRQPLLLLVWRLHWRHLLLLVVPVPSLLPPLLLLLAVVGPQVRVTHQLLLALSRRPHSELLQQLLLLFAPPHLRLC